MTAVSPSPHDLMAREASALLGRLEDLRPLAATMPMVAAAAGNPEALRAMDVYLIRGRRRLAAMVRSYLRWLAGPGAAARPRDAQRRLTVIRLRFHQTLNHLDIFADVATQRGEHDYGVWLGGLDELAGDALRLRDPLYQPPPVLTYLDRGAGATIRRARTRLPGGGENPVTLIRVPRERMIGTAVGSSLVHEVGHQAAALLDLVASVRRNIRRRLAAAGTDEERFRWRYYDRTASEIIADLWAVGRLGIGATVGLVSVVSLPRPFVFRVALDDPHPFPWLRVRISCAIGRILFGDAQWTALAGLWAELYPLDGLPPDLTAAIRTLDDGTTDLARLLAGHRPPALLGRHLGEILRPHERNAAALRRHFRQWRRAPDYLRTMPPSLAVAVLGQAAYDGALDPAEEARTLEDLLRYWALVRSVGRAGTRHLPPPAPAFGARTTLHEGDPSWLKIARTSPRAAASRPMAVPTA